MIKKFPNTSAAVIKLGGECNLNCSHCHSLKKEYPLNKDIFEFIKLQNFSRITFSGGEPLLYFDTIKSIMEIAGKEPVYRLGTNGTEITPLQVKFFNQYNTHVFISYDGEASRREDCYPRFSTLVQLKHLGMSITAYTENIDFKTLKSEVQYFRNRRLLNFKESRFYPNFIHQTELAPNSDVTRSTAQKYALQMCKAMEFDFMQLKFGEDVQNLEMLPIFVYRINPDRHPSSGCACCSEKMLNITLSGELLLCPYSYKVVGDIYTGLNLSKVEQYLPQRCQKCEFFKYCANTCIENITENECYIFKIMFRHFTKMCIKYSISFEEILSACKGMAL